MRLDEAGREDGVTQVDHGCVGELRLAYKTARLRRCDRHQSLRQSSRGLSGFIVMMELAVRICFDMA